MLRDIFVTNTNDFHHSDRYDGRDYEFPPKERVVISVEAATHMFGFGLADQTSILHRLGWAMKLDKDKKQFVEDEDGIKKLSRFLFTEGMMVEVPVKSAADVTSVRAGPEILQEEAPLF